MSGRRFVVSPLGCNRPDARKNEPSTFCNKGPARPAHSARGNAIKLFDLAKNSGKSRCGKEAEASEKNKQEIEQDSPGISDLDARNEDGMVSLSGKIASIEALKKAVPMSGNGKGIRGQGRSPGGALADRRS